MKGSMAIKGDSSEYDLLQKWCEETTLTDLVMTCEIGVREGLGSKIIMDTFIDRVPVGNYKHIGIDPYGNLKYQHYDTSPAYTADYTENMRCQLQKDLSIYTEFDLFHMTDVEFMNRFWDTGPYNLVHFDGPHMSKDVMTEAVWFANRAAPRARFIFDDYKKYQMDVIAYALTLYGFKTIESGDNKICLEKQT